MITFRQYITEAEKSEFQINSRIITHRKNVNGDSVVMHFHATEDYPHNYEVVFSVNRNFKKVSSNPAVLSHVRDVTDSFIRHFKPKKLMFNAFSRHANAPYQRFGEKMANKHHGEFGVESDGWGNPDFALRFPNH